MSLSRREFLRLAGLVAAGAAAGSACAPLYGEISGAYQAPEGSPPLVPADFRALNRLTYGPTPRELRRVGSLGLANWLEEQLAPESIDDGAAEFLVRRHDALRRQANGLEGLGREEVLRQLRAARLQRQIYSRRQVYERVVEFWQDHLNISVDKGDCWLLKPADERTVVRVHALGRFEDLLMASAQSPAMLVYLDNQANVAGAPNENYAREVMELHTLGVDGGYQQQDVMELARCLTGWTVKEHFWKGEYKFDPEAHDLGKKRVLGMEIRPSGRQEAERVLRALAAAEATSEHLAIKLVRRFVSDRPQQEAPALVRKVADAFRSSNGDLTAVIRTVLLDGLLPRIDRLPPKFKRPVDFVSSSLRMLAAKTDGGQPVHDHLAAMGQLPYAWPTPDGPPDTAESWSSNLVPRWQYALQLTLNELDGTEIDSKGLDLPAEGQAALHELSNRLLGAPPGGPLRQAVDDIHAQQGGAAEAELPRLMVAGLLASPQFQWR